jgi:hypothetical protein
MKSLGPLIATAAVALSGQVWAATNICAQTTPTTSAEFTPPAHPVYPSFCSIPLAPKNVRHADAFRAQVVTTRLAGAVLTRDTAPETWSLTGTNDFIDTGRREAEPPAPPAGVGPAETAAFLAEAKAKAAPPPKPRHRH